MGISALTGIICAAAVVLESKTTRENSDKTASLNPPTAGISAATNLVTNSASVVSSDLRIESSPSTAVVNDRIDVDKGKQQGNHGDLDGAYKSFNEAIANNPSDATAYTGRGHVKFDNGDFEGAMADFDKSILIDPTSPDPYVKRALLEGAEGNSPEALLDFQKALELAPDSSHILIQRSFTKLNSHDADGALADVNAALEQDPNSAEAYSQRGDIKRFEGDLSGAVADYTFAKTIDPENIHAYRQLGCGYFDNGRIQDAMNCLRHAVLLKQDISDHPRFYIWMIEAQQPDGLAKANKELGDYLHGDRGKTEDWNLQIGHFLLGESSQADLLKNAVSVYPYRTKRQYCEAYFYIGVKDAVTGDLISAKASFEQCKATNIMEYCEYWSADAWLKRIPSTEGPGK